MPLVTLHRMSDDAELDFEANASGLLPRGDILTWAGGSEVRVAAIINNGVGTAEAVQTTLANMPVLDISTSKPSIEHKADTSLSATLPAGITGAIIVVADEIGVYQLTDDLVAGAYPVQNTLGFYELAVLAADTPSADVDAVIANMKAAWGLNIDSWFEMTVRTTTPSELFTIPCSDNGFFRANIDWGDGSSSAITSYNDVDLAHTYAVAGDYTVTITGAFPNVYFDDSVDANKVIAASLNGNQTFSSIDSGFYGCSLDYFDASGLTDITDCSSAWRLNILTSFDASGLTNVTNCSYAWYKNNLTSFDASGLTNVTNCQAAWVNNSFTSFDASNLTSVTNCVSAWTNNSLTSFDASSLTSVTNCFAAWQGNSLTSFDASSLTSVTNCFAAWQGNSLTSFDASGLTSVTNCQGAWRINNLTSFDASGFATMGVPASNCFVSAWADGANALDAASVESILTNIDASGRSAPAVGPDIGISSDGDPLTSAAATAVTNLKAKNWTITINGVLQ